MPAGITSVFRIYGKGIAAENIRDFTDASLEITINEHFPGTHGEATGKYDESKITGEDSTGVSYAGKAKTTRTVTATWLPFGSNRLTPPSVRRGESVLVWATGDHGEYRWTPMGDHDFHRNTEVAVFGFNAAKDYNEKPKAGKSMYTLEINTERGFVCFNTTQARGEAAGTITYWDLLEGIFSYKDTAENAFTVSAKDKMLSFQNGAGSSMGIIGGNAWLEGASQAVISAPSIFTTSSLKVNGNVHANNFVKPGSGPKGAFNGSAASKPKR
jgi:hypothetical protein